MGEHRHLLKSASLISAFTILSRIFGYLRASRIAFLAGAGTAAEQERTLVRLACRARRKLQNSAR
jgi:hypothetical protein